MEASCWREGEAIVDGGQTKFSMVILAGWLGLARSEFVGLKWADIDWDAQSSVCNAA